jgi:hypothetical protein
MRVAKTPATRVFVDLRGHTGAADPEEAPGADAALSSNSPLPVHKTIPQFTQKHQSATLNGLTTA